MGAFGSNILNSPLASLTGAGIVRLGAARLFQNDIITSVVNWTDPYEQLLIYVAIPNYAGADVASLQFGNGSYTVDTGANYWNDTVTKGTGGVVLTDVPQASDTLIRLGVAGAAGRVAFVHVTNFQTKAKVVKASVTLNSANAATIPDSHISVEGAWFNTTDYIKSARLALPGAGKMGLGSQLIVFGMNAA